MYKKVLPIFLTLCLFLFVILLWLMAEDDNKTLKSRIDWYRNIKTPTKCEQTIKETCKVYEPKIIYKECIKKDCPVCDVEEWKNRAEIFEDKNWELLTIIEDQRQKCINF